MRQCVLVIGGGAGRPAPGLRGRTALQTARTPNLDRLAQVGRFTRTPLLVGGPGGEDPEGAGPVLRACGLLGMEERGPAAGPLAAWALLPPADDPAGLADDPPSGPMADWADAVAYRADLVTLDDGHPVDDRPGLSDAETAALTSALTDALDTDEVRFLPGAGGRGAVLVRGERAGLPDCVAPAHARTFGPEDARPEGDGAEAAELIMRGASDLLAAHEVNRVRLELGENPAQGLWLWGPGRLSDPTLLAGRGADADLVGAREELRGGVRAAGGQVLRVEGVTDRSDTLHQAYVPAAAPLLEAPDARVLVHVGSVEDAARSGDLRAWVAAWERVDARIVGPLHEVMLAGPTPWRLRVLCDRVTDPEHGRAAAGEVPVVETGEGDAPPHGPTARAFGDVD